MATDESTTSALLKKAFRIQPKRKTSEVAASSKPGSPSTEIEASPSLQYGALITDKKSIRLLEVLPGRDFESIQTRISVCDLNQKPSYIALSYTWDKDSQSKHIDCQGTRIEVGLNLWYFLQQYRRMISSRQHRAEHPVPPLRLWIDAISINQKNNEERSHQVSLMRDIYTGAESVIVWLGLAQGSEELAFLLTRHPYLLRVEEMSIALAALLDKPYWGRVWVVQEFVLARSVDIWCGELQASADAFATVWRGKNQFLPQQISHSRGMQLFGYRRDHRHSAKVKREPLGRRNSRTFRSTIRLREILGTFATSQSSEAYDKIYGFLGIATDGSGGKIRPDYSLRPVQLLVAVLRNQCHSTMKKAQDDDYNFLIFLMRTLGVSRVELIRYILWRCPEVQQHLFVLAVPEFMVASVSFVSTIQNVGSTMEEAEAFMPSTWKPGWLLQSSMHPKSMSNQDLYDLGQQVARPETSLVLSFADPHVPGGFYIGSEIPRGKVIAESTELVIRKLIQLSDATKAQEDHFLDRNLNIQELLQLRDAFSKSMSHSNGLYLDARPKLFRRDTSSGQERYVSFTGTNGYIGMACVRGFEVLAGDRVCTFAGVTDSNNAFVVRLDTGGRWVIIGFAIILLPPDPNKELAARADRNATTASERPGTLSRHTTLETDKTMCFHCHLTDILELQRCQILNKTQMDWMLRKTLKMEKVDKLHRCNLGEGQHDVLEFGV